MDPIESLGKRIDSKRDQMIEMQRALTAVPALGPQNGGEGEWEKAQVLGAWLGRLGLGPCEFHSAPDRRVPRGERPNIVVTVPGGPDNGTFWIMTHMDIVPPGELRLWNSDPYTMVIAGDRLIGRGVEDNQQSLVASVFAAASVKELGMRPRRTVRLLLVSDEETGSVQGVQHVLAASGLFSRRDVALVPDSGSPEGNLIEIAEKNILWLRFIVTGRQCHASTPEKGVNAFEAGSHLVVRLGSLRERFNATNELFSPPSSTFVPTRKEANVPNVNTLPGEDVFYLDCRVLPQENLEEVIREIRRICDSIQRDFNVKVDIEEVQRASSPPTSPDAPIVSTLRNAIREVYRVEASTVGIGGGTVGAYLRAAGIPTVVWSRIEETAHQPNEYCLISNMLGDSLVMALTMVAQDT
ncbi:MAG TPA: M20 family metallo-hydrolase [Spirochaetia bacterium]|nr:M20 family metallo-hydrolase [Spirochaetia bacterium]